jgi:hypothetical protein
MSIVLRFLTVELTPSFLRTHFGSNGVIAHFVPSFVSQSRKVCKNDVLSASKGDQRNVAGPRYGYLLKRG